jgi:hypothetical protein
MQIPRKFLMFPQFIFYFKHVIGNRSHRVWYEKVVGGTAINVQRKLVVRRNKLKIYY